MNLNKQILQSIGFAIIGLVYGVLLRFLGAGLGGAGHGTVLFYVLAVSPFGVEYILWPTIGSLIPFLRKPLAIVATMILLLSHYGFVFYWWFRLADYPEDTLKGTFIALPVVFSTTVAIYISGQTFLWLRMFHAFRSKKYEPKSQP